MTSRWRDRERQPRIPALGPVLGGELLVPFDIDVTLVIFAGTAKGWTIVDMKQDWKRVFAFE
jgi:hypothetical protein